MEEIPSGRKKLSLLKSKRSNMPQTELLKWKVMKDRAEELKICIAKTLYATVMRLDFILSVMGSH